TGKRGPSLIIKRSTCLRCVLETSRTNISSACSAIVRRQIGGEYRFERADDRTHFETDQFLKQALLVGEVQIDRALVDTGTFGDIVEPCRCKAASGKFVERGVEDRVAPRHRLERAWS